MNWICAPIIESTAAAFLNAIGEAAKVADAIELRLDYLGANELPLVLESLPRLEKPLIVTFRPREQGGMRDLSLRDRRTFWASLSKDSIDKIAFADFELDLVESYADQQPPIPWSNVICSWHNFDETPDDLPIQFERMSKTPAAIVKIATMANRISDSLPIFEIIDRAGRPKPVIGLAMGLPGLATRVLALSRGAVLTFGALRKGAESAGGQPTAAELRDLYRVKRLSRSSEIFGIIGNPVGHSRSPLMHNAALKALDRNGVYLPFEVDDVDQFVLDFVRPASRKLDWNLRGLSVTIPHKLGIIPHLDFIDETAKKIGAVNTVVVEGDKLRGHNTDVIGAMAPLDELMDVKGASVAVIGAGGSARAICYGLSERKAVVTVFARDMNKARRLADEFNLRASSLEDFTGGCEMLINCTPIGMHGHSEGRSPIKAQALDGVKLVYDLIYSPPETALLRDARNAGCHTLGGLAMLLGQAAEQFRLWTGQEAPIEVMRQALRNGTP